MVIWFNTNKEEYTIGRNDRYIELMITTCIMIGINLSVQFEALSYAYPKLVVYINKELLAFRDTWVYI
jgi:hypothetical protein